MRIASRLEKQGYKFATLIHPNAVVGSRCTVGEGTVICPFVCVTCDVKIGRHVILNVHAVVGHDAIIGDGCTINPHCDITGWVTLGEGVLMGAGATIMPKLKVGAYSVIGSGSAPYRNVDDLATMVGIPAKKIFGHEPIVIDNWQPEPGP
jgi:sugar O-acyltransferase (sialic acid O-acetyltransferase NeuD family)